MGFVSNNRSLELLSFSTLGIWWLMFSKHFESFDRGAKSDTLHDLFVLDCVLFLLSNSPAILLIGSYFPRASQKIRSCDHRNNASCDHQILRSTPSSITPQKLSGLTFCTDWYPSDYDKDRMNSTSFTPKWRGFPGSLGKNHFWCCVHNLLNYKISVCIMIGNLEKFRGTSRDLEAWQL